VPRAQVTTGRNIGRRERVRSTIILHRGNQVSLELWRSKRALVEPRGKKEGNVGTLTYSEATEGQRGSVGAWEVETGESLTKKISTRVGGEKFNVQRASKNNERRSEPQQHLAREKSNTGVRTRSAQTQVEKLSGKNRIGRA